MEIIMAILVGIGLSAAVGFRIFTPLLITSVAENASWITLTDGFSWIGSTPALIAFLVATLLEISTNYIPIVDQIMKMIASPVAILAGVLLTASFIGEMHPLLSWSIAIIAGGGTASVTQMATTTIRGASTVTTGGIGNMFLSVFEGFFAIVMSIVSLFLPIIAAIFVLLLFIVFFIVIRKIRKRLKNKEQPAT